VLLRLRHWALAAVVAFPALALAQAPSTSVAPPRNRTLRDAQVLSPARVPGSPLELVTEGARLARTAEEREAVIALLTKARQLLNVRAQPYDLKTTFAVSSSAAANGTWILEDTYPSSGLYRWTAQGPAYSAIYLLKNNIQYSDQRGAAIPLRLIQVREAIFFTYPVVTEQTRLRAADASLNGLNLRCALLQQRFDLLGEALPPGRSWDEFEYCIDPRSGLLVTYSPAPGLYIHYDYSKAFRFHKQIIPGAFSIAVARETVIEAKIQSLRNPIKRNRNQFEPGELSQLGVGPMMTTGVGMYGQLQVPSDLVSDQGTGDMVIAHGELSSDGRVSNVEILTGTNTSLNPYAMDRASRWRRPEAAPDQPGTTPQTREVIFRFAVVAVPSPMRPNEIPESALITCGSCVQLDLSELPLPKRALPPLVPPPDPVPYR
jgi:hypothetical protein